MQERPQVRLVQVRKDEVFATVNESTVETEFDLSVEACFETIEPIPAQI